jgi:hypothetical protein
LAQRSKKGAAVIRIEDAAGVKQGPDVAQILRSVGEATYDWRLGTDTLTWSDNAAELLNVSAAAIASGRAFAQQVEVGDGQSRFDAVMHPGQRDEGAGVAYLVHYLFRVAKNRDAVCLEDTGRWFTGPDGKPERAHGVVRASSPRAVNASMHSPTFRSSHR